MCQGPPLSLGCLYPRSHARATDLLVISSNMRFYSLCTPRAATIFLCTLSQPFHTTVPSLPIALILKTDLGNMLFYAQNFPFCFVFFLPGQEHSAEPMEKNSFNRVSMSLKLSGLCLTGTVGPFPSQYPQFITPRVASGVP